MNLEKLGRLAFYVGLIISVLAGFVNLGAMGLLALVILGLIVGGLNVTGREVQKFLLATVALLLVGQAIRTLSTLPSVGDFVGTVISHFVAFVAGAALLVALREVYDITKSQ